MSNRIYILNIIAFSVLLFSCKNKNADSLFTELNSSHTNITFSNNIEEDGTYNIYNFMNIYTGAGVGIGDFNNDGLSDLFFAGNMVQSELYLNKGDFIFEDITSSAGINKEDWATGVSVIDINQDGWLDIYVCVSGADSIANRANKLYINQKNNTFKESAKEYGLADTSQSTQAAFFDYDLDGDLDMFLIINPVDYSLSSVNTIKPRQLDGTSNSTDKLYKNNGNNTFTDVSKEAGILIEGYSLGLGISDIDNDGWPDVYVSNDFLTNDILYMNQGDGTFLDVSKNVFKHTSFAGMGNDIADFNNDGLMDIMVLDMLPEDNERQKMIIPSSNFDKFQLTLARGYTAQYTRNTLQLNNGNNSFSEIGQLSGMSKTDWSWSVLMADYDNDGYKDTFITNGFRRDIGDLDYINYQNKNNNAFGTKKSKRQQKLDAIKALPSAAIKNYFYKNNADLTFTNVSEKWGITEASLSNGAAFSDLDNDGDLDLVVNNINKKASILRNNSEKKRANFIKVKLEGQQGNSSGIGTKVTLYSKNKQQYYQHFLTRGYESSIDPLIHFGLGETALIDSLKIVWPDNKMQLLTDVVANNTIIVKHSNSLTPNTIKPEFTRKIFQDISEEVAITTYTHKENDFVDFKIQPLLPHMHSKNGPKMTSGDINGDGLDDLYIGGSSGYSGSFFTQQSNGTFKETLLNQDITSEDMGSLLFDADNDGDNDLYITSGGSEFKKDSEQYQDRLYINDGKGNFTKNKKALPNISAAGAIVTASDFDKDGDLDLFVGSNITPGAYPLAPRSFILRNDSGVFTDITSQMNTEIPNVGMVTAAIWIDYDNDNLTDLIITGEFMPIRIFKNKGEKFEEVTSEAGLSNTSGWWNCITAEDMDGDGDIDFIAGNLGTNSRYKASITEPLCIYAKDYDKNGSLDPIMCYYIQGENYIAHPRNKLINQINAMRSRFKTYREYADIKFEDAFLPQELEGAYVVKAQHFSSSYIENLGDGTFKITPLPHIAQFAPVNNIKVIDINQDKNLDLILIGNNTAGEASIGNHNAMTGSCLLGDGKGNFTPLPISETGFFVNSTAKDMIQIETKANGAVLVISSNSAKLKALKLNQKLDRKE